MCVVKCFTRKLPTLKFVFVLYYPTFRVLFIYLCGRRIYFMETFFHPNKRNVRLDSSSYLNSDRKAPNYRLRSSKKVPAIEIYVQPHRKTFIWVFENWRENLHIYELNLGSKIAHNITISIAITLTDANW